MSMTKQLWSLNGLATEFGKDRRTVAKALSNVPPDGHVSGEKRWYLTTALRALDRGRQVASVAADELFSNILLDRVANWREIHFNGDVQGLSVEEIAEFSGVAPADVLAWLRAGMPYWLEGDWTTGKGFQIPLPWAIDWQVLVTGYATHVGRQDLRDKLGLGG
jgi:hypothetical protein